MSKKPIDYASPQDLSPLNRLDRRWIAFAVGVAIWAILVFAYVGGMWAVSLYRVVIEGMCLIAWLVAAMGIGSTLLRLFRLNRVSAGAPLLVVTSASLGLGAMSLLVLGLGLMGLLNRSTAIGIVAGGVILSFAWLLRSNLQTPDIKSWFARWAGWSWLWLLTIPFAAVLTVGAMYPPYLLWTHDEPHGYDVVEYHLQIPREWFEAHRIIPLTHNAFSFFPFNVEMHYLFAMHLRGGPWAGMYLAQFMHAGFMLLLVLAVWAGADAIFPKKPDALRGPSAGIVAGLAVVAAPLITQLGAIAYDEGGFLLFGILSLIWSILAIRDVDHRTRRFILAGVFAGLSCGSKLTSLPEILAAIGVIAGVTLLMQKSPGIMKRLAPVAVFGIAGLLTFSPWLIRNQVWVGNPVFPELPALGHGYFSPAQLERWHHAHSPRPDQQGVGARFKAGATEVVGNWQFGYLLIPAALVTLCLSQSRQPLRFLGARMKTDELKAHFKSRQPLRILGTMLLILAVFWLGFTHLQGRFFALGIPICALILAGSPRFGIVVVIVTLLIGVVTLNREFLAPERRDAIAFIGSDDLGALTPPAMQEIPATANIALVGDARAFLYQVPMSRLTYRTIFDVNPDASPNFIELFAGPKDPSKPEWLLIDPDELKRFAKTYQPFPAVPADIARHDQPYAVQR